MAISGALLQEIANPKQLQVADPLQRASQALQLQNLAQSLQTAKTQQADIEQQVQQRQISNQQATAAAQAIHDHVLNGGSLDDDALLQKLYAVSPGIGENFEKTRGESKKAKAETEKAGAETEKARAEAKKAGYMDVGGRVYDFATQTFKEAPLNPLQEAQRRKENADAAKAEAEAGALPQTADAAAAQIDAIAPPTDKSLADTNTRYKAELNAGTYSPARGADIVKRASEEAKSISVAKNTVPFKVEVQNAGAAQANGAGLDLMAEQALNGSFTSRNPVLLSKVYARAAELAKERGLSSTGVIMAQNAAKANKEALNAITNQMTQVEAFSQTAAKNMTILEKASKEVGDYGAPFLNTPIRALSSKYAGDPKVTQFIAALQPVQTEIAKILNSSNATGVLTDSARHEMEAAMGPGSTPQQIKAALDIFRQDIANRKETYQAMQKDLIGQTAVGAGAAEKSDPLGIR